MMSWSLLCLGGCVGLVKLRVIYRVIGLNWEVEEVKFRGCLYVKWWCV